MSHATKLVIVTVGLAAIASIGIIFQQILV